MKRSDEKGRTPRHLRVIELFAGVGGFRVGLTRASEGARDARFEMVWADQWEPATQAQHAAQVYEQVFFRARGVTDAGSIGKEFCNEDIWQVVGQEPHDTRRIGEIPELDMLTGGFPCQDYSVARPLSKAAGLTGKKGVLWWSIHKILQHAQAKKGGKPVPYLFLEPGVRADYGGAAVVLPADKTGWQIKKFAELATAKAYIVADKRKVQILNASNLGAIGSDLGYLLNRYGFNTVKAENYPSKKKMEQSAVYIPGLGSTSEMPEVAARIASAQKTGEALGLLLDLPVYDAPSDIAGLGEDVYLVIGNTYKTPKELK